MARQAWTMVGVNMMPSDHDRLVRLADLWGLSKAAAVRRLIQEATVGFDDRGGHTCREGHLAAWGTSNPGLKDGRCMVCWPTPPTVLEREDGMRAAAHQRQIDPDGRMIPWFVHVAERRRLHALEAAEAVDEDTEARERIADDEATWDEEELRKPTHQRICTARTRKGNGPRCKRGVGVSGDPLMTRCKQHRR